MAVRGHFGDVQNNIFFLRISRGKFARELPSLPRRGAGGAGGVVLVESVVSNLGRIGRGFDSY
jgi:hypothetical protein